MSDRYDVIVVGSGAGDGTLAHTLAPSGKTILFADASIFPSIGAVNPALTVMANAIRVGDHIAGRRR